MLQITLQRLPQDLYGSYREKLSNGGTQAELIKQSLFLFEVLNTLMVCLKSSSEECTLPKLFDFVEPAFPAPEPYYRKNLSQIPPGIMTRLTSNDQL